MRHRNHVQQADQWAKDLLSNVEERTRVQERETSPRAIYPDTRRWMVCFYRRSFDLLEVQKIRYGLQIFHSISISCHVICFFWDFITLRLFSKFGFPHTQSTPLFADNTSVIRITENFVLHEQTKHIEVDFHFIQDEYDHKVISLPHVSTKFHLADIFQQTLSRLHHKFLVRKSLPVDSPVSNLRGNIKWTSRDWAFIGICLLVRFVHL